VAGTPQSTIGGTAFATALTARAVDRLGGGVGGVSVAFSAPGAGASATLGASPVVTNSTGDASISATANLVAGSYSVTASTSGFSSATFALTNNRIPQTISGFAPASPVMVEPLPITLSATASSGLTVTFATTSAATICTVTGNQVTFTGRGVCNLTANQLGDANYLAAAQVTVSITINRGTQTITGFAPASSVVFGASPVALSAAASSGLTIFFATTSAATVCTVAGNQVSFNGVGTCNLTANQFGNTNYFPAPQVTASIIINRATQTVTGFAPVSPVVFGAAPATLSAIASSGLSVGFGTTSAATVCTVLGNQVTFVGVGTCDLTADQVGNANYLAAPQVTASITINQAMQTITGFTPASPVIFGSSPSTLIASASSGLTVTFATTSAASVCTVAGNQVSFVGVGTCNLTANQAGGGNYTAAPQVLASIVINQAPQTIIGFAPTSPVVFGTPPTTLSATASSVLSVAFATTSANTICTVSGNQVTFVGVGTCNLTANQAGNGNYLAAPQVTASIVINQAPQTIVIASTPASLFTNAAPFTVTATGGASGNVVTFTTITPLICTSSGVNGSLITLTQQNGICTIRANQLGNANYLAATNTDRSIAIGFEPPPPPPTAPTNLVCTASVVVADSGTIDCTYTASTSESSRNPIQSYRLYCTNDITSTAVQITVAASLSGAAIANAPVGRYTCNVTAQGLTSASEPSATARVVLSATPLALSNQFDPDSKGFATILVRGSTPSIAEMALTTKATTTTLIGRFDGAKFNFTPTSDMGEGWNVMGLGDVTGTNRSSTIGRNASNDVRVDTASASTILRKAQPDWVLEAVTDLDGDGKADMVWRYIKPGTNDSGVIFAWYMSDGTPLGATSVPTDVNTIRVNEVKRRGGAPLTWSLIGATDIDGDGRGDLIWLSPSNEIRSLTSKANRTWVNERIGQLPAGFSIIKLGDVNGDGKGDIVFKDASGNVRVWLLDGTSVLLDSVVGNVAAGTTYYAAGDFDGDGTMDIVWKKADGTLILWLMNKAIVNQPTVIDNVGQAPAGLVVVE
jgi:trimeric autotransporter adhesin